MGLTATMHPLLRTPLRWFNLHPLWRRLPVRVWGSRLRAPTADRFLALFLHRWRLMGAADRRFLAARVRPGMTVVDIGANQGLYTLLFARLVGQAGAVLAFEPDDMLHAALCENIAGNRAETVRPYHAALGSQVGSMTLHRSLLNSGDNRLAPEAGGAGPREAVSIRVERLDQVLSGQRVDFIKLDVQGWEREVFQGMTGLLDNPQNARLAIYFEFWPQGLRDAGSDPAELLAFLASRGFAIHRPLGAGVGPAVKNLSSLAASPISEQYINLFAVRS